MSRLVILGAGIAGHTAALHACNKLKDHELMVISPNSRWNWIPSNIWVGIGMMEQKQVLFPLEPVYKKKGIAFKQAKAISIHPEGDSALAKPFVTVEYTSDDKKGTIEKVEYDFLMNATGPRLNFAATTGLGPEKNSCSVCTAPHAAETYGKLEKIIEMMKKGERKKLLIGTGHGQATCQGAAFEYALNIAFEINIRKLNEFADIWWISNEYELGDFGMGGAYVKRNGYITPTKIFTESILKEHNIRWIKRAGVTKIEEGKVHYENLDGKKLTKAFDFAMLIPAFAGAGMKAYDKINNDITSKVFAANGMMKVDADYTTKPYEEWKASDWPHIYQSPAYDNMYASGIAFAPPHGMSKPMESPNGTKIFPTPPRTGMPSGVIGKIVAQNIAHRIKTGKNDHPHLKDTA